MLPAMWQMGCRLPPPEHPDISQMTKTPYHSHPVRCYHFVPVGKFSTAVIEELKSSGPTSIVVQWIRPSSVISVCTGGAKGPSSRS